MADSLALAGLRIALLEDFSKIQASIKVIALHDDHHVLSMFFRCLPFHYFL
jgi:hypothetical protein